MTERKPCHVRLHYVLPPEERGAYRSLPDEAKATWKNALLAEEQIDAPGERGHYFVSLSEEEQARFEAAGRYRS